MIHRRRASVCPWRSAAALLAVSCAVPAWAQVATPPQLVTDINAGPGGSTPSLITSAGGQLMFRASDAARGAELWLRPLAGGPLRVADILSGPDGSSPSSILGLSPVLCSRRSARASGGSCT
ncbi:MAG: hypothetical protein KIT68_07525 [Phycisphaeraceae bacterium]|nr:hypothetical protein [Phycisphaeraceae bacterium]